MRKPFILLLLALLLTAQANFAQVQDPAQPGSQPDPQAGSPSRAAQQAASDPAAQPLSVAEIARLARSRKQADATAAVTAKPAKVVLDDDNMPRGVYASDAPSGPANSGPPAGSPTSVSAPFSEYRGKVVLLDFWASWCGPCRSALPNLKRLQSVYGGDDFVVVSISEDDDEATWRTFATGHQMTWPQRFDVNGSMQHEFGVHALPTYVLLGRDGSILQKVVGEDPAQSITERLGSELKKGLSTKP